MPNPAVQLNTRLKAEGVDADVCLIHDAEPSSTCNTNNIYDKLWAQLAIPTDNGCVKTVTPPNVFSWTSTPPP